MFLPKPVPFGCLSHWGYVPAKAKLPWIYWGNGLAHGFTSPASVVLVWWETRGLVALCGPTIPIHENCFQSEFLSGVSRRDRGARGCKGGSGLTKAVLRGWEPGDSWEVLGRSGARLETCLSWMETAMAALPRATEAVTSNSGISSDGGLVQGC